MGANAITFWAAAYNIVINKVSFANFSCTADVSRTSIQFYQASASAPPHTVQITSCTFNNVGYGVRLYYDWSSTHITAPPYGFDIAHCRFTDITQPAIITHTGLGSTETNYIRNCDLKNIGDGTREKLNALQLSYCTGLYVQDNTIDTVLTTGTGDGVGIILDFAHTDTNYPCNGVVVRRNKITGCNFTGTAAIDFYFAVNCLAYNNYLYANYHGFNVKNSTTTGSQIYNNTIVMTTAHTAILMADETASVTVRNNIMYGGSHGIWVEAGTSLPTEDHNSFYGQSVFAYYLDGTGEQTPAATDITADPKLGGMWIDSNSPCIGAGATIADVTTDILGVARPVGTAHDIGCLEFRPAGHYGTGLVGVGVN